jgi:choice-of-anchor A domain-containing protein
MRIGGGVRRARRQWPAPVALVCTVVCSAVIAVSVHSVLTAGAAQAAAPINPVRPVSPGDAAADPSHGFLVLVEGDAGLYQNETEGPVAIGGDVRFRNYRVGLNNAGSYVIPGESRPVGLVVGGAPDFAGSPAGGSLSVLNNTYAKFGDLSGSTVLPSDGVTLVTPAAGTGATSGPVSIQTNQPGPSVGGPSGFDFAGLFSTYRSLNTGIAACPGTVRLTDQNGQNPWNGTDPVATIGLQAGQNVLTLTPAQLSALQSINPRNGFPQPDDTAWLIINVEVSGDYTWSVPQVSWQGNTPSRHVLWNFTTTGTITLPPGSPTVWGTIYAPNAALVDNSSSNIEGNVVVRTLTEGDPGTVDGGEIHYAPFADLVTPCADQPTPTTTTTTTTSTTTTTPSVTTTTVIHSTTPLPTTGPATSGGSTDSATVMAVTGAPITPLSVLALLLLASGAVLLVVRHRRRS